MIIEIVGSLLANTAVATLSLELERLEVEDKYGDDLLHALASLAECQATALHGVDGTQLDTCTALGGRQFDLIWWNLPHVGGGNSHVAVEANRYVFVSLVRHAQLKAAVTHRLDFPFA